jgi:uncharacterized repeat protein (TIGR03803 family)
MRRRISTSAMFGLIFDSTGNIYGTTIAGGSDGGGTVFEIFPFDEN